MRSERAPIGGTDNAGPAIFGRIWDTGVTSPEDMEVFAHLAWKREAYSVGQALNADFDICFLTGGLSFRQRCTPSGGRQLLSILLPGDMCSHAFLTGRRPLANAVAATSCTVVRLSIEDVLPVWEQHPNLLAALLLNFAVDCEAAEELVVSIGRRTALERMAYFLCELEFRFDRIGLSSNSSFSLPLTQADMGDYLALSAVHVNRTMQTLRHSGLVENKGANYCLLQPDKLRKLSGFSSAYLAHH
ncbi:Crp/Fnr family transcriptional regulator [Devosia chinhatensis]|uniref:HTH crp-type domain-containing protein n=1 Tax=Devosia chinhatensis TaxID=429727 RepID=A0A0F5FM49_9HYPH|nr:Crp/Fnr family transcriptional regulator [Devosia chinhatensis]KKB09272.1 hypothetical protein VE26_04685 [Devosia chinhatensis]